MGEVKAIETEYAGCLFRSRLEARWAVFFDYVGLKWEYEAQGYETAGGRYLPDFWLPDIHIWAEVKGEMSKAAWAKIMGAVPDLREPPDKQMCPQLLILGPVPRPGFAWAHMRIDLLGGFVLLSNVYWHVDEIGPTLKTIGHPCVFKPNTDWVTPDDGQTQFFCDWATTASIDDRLTVDPLFDAAYTAARSARFEYGQSGA